MNKLGRHTGDGGIAQLVEHKLCKLGVTGSNPVASTMTLAESGVVFYGGQES